VVLPPVQFGTVSRDALPDQIAGRLIALISERHLRPGDRLPAERELSVTMGVSRSSLREALRALSMLGVTEMRHGDGTYVTSLEPEALLAPVGLVLALSDSGFEDLFEARKLVEPGLAALAATRAGDDAIAALWRLVGASEAALGDDEAFLRVDLELHGLISRAASNAILTRLLDSIGGMAVASRRATVGIPGLQAASAVEHREIVAAVAAHDADRAHAAMLAHLENVERRRAEAAG
jgi:GntR family transcriptional repressor for pyruvate dehydrogenase complex